MKTILIILLFVFSLSSCAHSANANYPADWWTEIPRSEAKDWEILPQDAKPGEVILSKRTELGVFSNLSHSPFVLDGVKYNSIEGLWQGMKYPDPDLLDDERFKETNWPHKREEVYLLSSWDSKSAGDLANKIYKANKFSLINYKDHKFNYNDGRAGSAFHLDLITKAITGKINQNPAIKKLLIQTKGLILKPDHKMKEDSLGSYKYHEILMKIRDEI
ncbi:MAG: hypothetical protein WC635_06010 [Bacteriovorax sp.]|jgi:predicted NAD-dependent protein-ADP-ribosyltransferase YbiA (DUF1768 family)